MKKIIRVFTLIISVLLVVINLNNYFSKREWIETTATITFVGLPDGVVFGDYTDINGCIHENVLLYTDYFHQGNGVKVDTLSGRKVDIIYNPFTNEIEKKSKVFVYFSLFFIIITVFLQFLLKSTESEVKE